ncbi:WD40 repeat-like protein [Meredithblackwellia eburnea MCA 4105]
MAAALTAAPNLPQPHPRRVSYVLPPPSSPPATLGLPPVGIRKGEPGPFYVHHPPHHHSGISSSLTSWDGDHIRHRLAVQALALDLTTAVTSPSGSSGNNDSDPAPGGILYLGGRDGLVSSWELGLPTRRRRKRYGHSSPSASNGTTGGQGSESDSDSASDRDDDEEDEPTPYRNGGVRMSLNEMAEGRKVSNGTVPRRPKARSTSRARRDSSTDTARLLANEQLPIEDRWEVDHDRLKSNTAPPAKFRQCIQSHTDWVNDVVLCNYNRTLVSASSDSLLIAWNPHSASHEDQVTPNHIGRHGDYVRCLASAREAHWVASGGFDRKIKLWDVAEGRSTAALELPSPPSSIYSLATTPSGSLLAAGTPERVIRVWDPLSKRQVSRLGGHTDNVRAVLLSEDGKWVLSASSDTTVKLWSLTAQRCLHTFSHHSSAVWSLFSQHPALERFYSGDKQGNICKIDIEGTGDPGEGECIVLARDSPEESSDVRAGYEGITQLVAQDDSYVWTAGGSSSVKRWLDVPPKRQRVGAIVPQARADPVTLDSAFSTSESHDHLLGNGYANSSYTPPVSESPPDRSSDRPSAPSVTFLQDLTSTLSRTTSSPTPQPSYAQSSATSPLNTGRPSSLRTRPTTSSAFRHPRQSMDEPHPSFSSGDSTPGPGIPQIQQSFSTTLAEIPYDALVPLTSPDEGFFSPGFSTRLRDPDASTIYSASVVSVPYAGFGSLPHRVSISTSPSGGQLRPRSIAETLNDGPEAQATHVSRREYEERESASEATPLRSAPDDVVEGRVGLTRCELLNDRRHALTVDTDGRVALWDIVECRCIGVFAQEELHPASRRPSDARSNGSQGSNNEAPQDLLDFVKERIEGEAAVATWCKCDTRVGALTVHLEESRVFDAEIYIDEAHLGPVTDEFPVDHRLFLGKWVLRQLFDGFIDVEMQHRAKQVAKSPASTPQPPSTRAMDPPRFISLADLGQPNTSPKTAKTPGMTIALATPAARKAVLPPLPLPSLATSPRNALWDLAPIPPSPGGPLTPRLADTTAPGTPTGTKTPTGSRGGGDYFSLLPTQAPDPQPAPSVPLGSPSPMPTPGGTLMGRLRLLGKSSKRPSTGEVFESSQAAPVVPETPGDDPLSKLSIEERQQHRILEAVLSGPLVPCPLLDAPSLRYQDDMAVLISEETPDASAWAVTYRGLIGTAREDVHVLEQKAPFWLLDFLLGNRIVAKDPVKISFVIQPWIDTVRAGLPELPNANARLTANRSLRMRKVMGYIADKLDLCEPNSRSASISGNSNDGKSAPAAEALASLAGRRPPFSPEDDLEILCGDTLLTPKFTLAVVRTFYWKQGGDLVLSYRLKQK